MKTSLASILCAALAAFLLAGCATPSRPLYCAGNFRPEDVDRFHLLPVVDARVDKKLKLNTEHLQRQVGKWLKGKRYAVVPLTDTNLVARLTDEDLKEPAPDLFRSLGPEEARWLFIVEVAELSRKLTFGSTGNAEVLLLIADKQSGSVVWRDKALGRAGQGGLIGMMMIGMMDDEAMANALAQVVMKLPKKPKKS